ncbi:MAG: hypothetical protein ACRDFS_04000 [Chloroflexota bacterium]
MESPNTTVEPTNRPAGALCAIQLIETVGEREPFDIVPAASRFSGNASSASDVMAAKVKWATKAGYVLLTTNVPKHCSPYTAIIRVIGTEDYMRDYLARFTE